MWIDEEGIEVPIETKKKLKTLFEKSGVRFHVSLNEVDSDEFKHRARNFAKQISAFNNKCKVVACLTINAW